MLLSSLNADPLTICLALVELRARQSPDSLATNSLAICLVAAPSPPLATARSGEQVLPTLQHNKAVAEMPRDDAPWLLPSCAPMCRW
jgi:hypothetical protein